MAGNFTKLALLGSTNGKQIKVAATSSPGTAIHTAGSGTSSFDEIWLFADNDDTVPHVLTIEFGGTTDVDNTIKVTIPAKGTEGSDGLTPVVAGLILQNSLAVKAYADLANKLKISGYVNRIA